MPVAMGCNLQEHASFDIGLQLPFGVSIYALSFVSLLKQEAIQERQARTGLGGPHSRKDILEVCATGPDQVRPSTACRYHAFNGRGFAETVLSVSRCHTPASLAAFAPAQRRCCQAMARVPTRVHPLLENALY